MSEKNQAVMTDTTKIAIAADESLAGSISSVSTIQKGYRTASSHKSKMFMTNDGSSQFTTKLS